MKCPVCKETVSIHELLCQHCGFSELHREFINVADALDWEQQIVIPYRTKWEAENNIEPWLKKEYECRAYHNKISEQNAAQTIFLKDRTDLQVENSEKITRLRISDQFDEQIDDELVADIAKFCNLRDLSIAFFYRHEICADRINKILAMCSNITTLAIYSKIGWQTFAKMDLDHISNLSISLQGDVEAVCVTAPRLKSLDLSIYFDFDLRFKLPRKQFDFSGMPLLEEVKILHGMGMDYASLSTLKNLKKLRIVEDSKLKDFSWISDAYQLDKLEVSSCRLKSISGLECQRKLRHLYLANNLISNIDSLAKLNELESLNLRVNKIENVDAISKLTKLKQLDLFRNCISDDSFLKRMGIQMIYVSDFDYEIRKIDHLLYGYGFGSEKNWGNISDDAYRWIQRQDNAVIDSSTNRWRKEWLEEWKKKTYDEKLKEAIQSIFESEHRDMCSPGKHSNYSRFDLQHRRIYIERALRIYPFLKLNLDMLLDMRKSRK